MIRLGHLEASSRLQPGEVCTNRACNFPRVVLLILVIDFLCLMNNKISLFVSIITSFYNIINII